MNICIIDNFDSFTFNLLEEFQGVGNTIHVWRNSMDSAEIKRRLFALAVPRLLVFSPGPGHPDQAGCMNELIKDLAGQVPMFGVCLGMQAMVSVFGGQVKKAPDIVHGKAKPLIHDGKFIFYGLKDRIAVGRYHSLTATVVPEEFEIFGRSDELVMAISHRKYPMIGIQFHPESVLSTQGSRIIKNLIDWAGEHS
ncbi:MAG: aminodeoxychorismate/anthranilate synthase component II [Myxococcales bacterium]|nr:aminodeoxychorismate/anthranilate synthase component II [Myxococcales bacterium]USN51701.1 MAG: aminodeoxychorismate/anthranilate synthase component II [Myxococcales bacterium]